MSNDSQRAPDPEAASRRLARSLQDSLAAADTEAPSFEDVAAYAEGRLQGADRELFEERLAGDPLLRAEVEDLRLLRREMEPGRHGVPEWARWAAAAIVVASVAGWLWTRGAGNPGGTPTAQGPGPEAAGSASPNALLRLKDESGPVALLADGSVEGVPTSLGRSVADALRSGTLHVPALRSDLAVSGVTPMGTTGPDAVFSPSAPLSTLVLSDRPQLRWSHHGHARGYVVSVYDLDLEPVAASPRLTTNEWTPVSPLARGRTYLWQVEAITLSGEKETVPAPPQPEARFHVASATAERETREALATAGRSHLAAGVVLAGRGFLDEAAQEFERLDALNPGSAEVARLRASLGAARRRPTR